MRQYRQLRGNDIVKELVEEIASTLISTSAGLRFQYQTVGHPVQVAAKIMPGCGVVSYVNRCSFLRTAFACIFAHYNTFKGIFAHFLRAAF